VVDDSLRVKEFQNMESDDERIKHILGILSDLGIEGTPSIAKCIELKKRREEAQELEELSQNQILDSRTRRTPHSRSSTIPNVNSVSRDELEVPPPKPTFKSREMLKIQDDDDSDGS